MSVSDWIYQGNKLLVGNTSYRTTTARVRGVCKPPCSSETPCGDRVIHIGEKIALSTAGWSHPRCLLYALNLADNGKLKPDGPTPDTPEAAQAIRQHRKNAEQAKIRARQRARKARGL